MNVLSLFDGCSGGQQALERSGHKVDKYFASEIDKYAIQVTMANYPNTIQLGSVVDVDVNTLPKIDILLGGSPCQSFSFAGKRKGMSTKDEQEILTLDHYLQLKSEGFEFEGQSYLFWEYMRILTELRIKNPNVYFLLENVEMGEKWEKVLSKAIGVNGIHINSALVSAQNRKRIYWTNIGLKPSGLFGDLTSIIEQPKDRGILLKDILESEVNEKYFLSEKMINWLDKHSEKRNVDVKKLDGEQKSATITSTALMKGNLSTDYIMHSTFGRTSTNGNGGSGHLSKEGDKSYCLDVANSMAVEIVLTNKDKRLQKIVDDNTFIDGEVAHLDTYNQTIDKDKSPALKLPHNDRFIFAPTKSTNEVEIVANGAKEQVVGRKAQEDGTYKREYEVSNDEKAKTLETNKQKNNVEIREIKQISTNNKSNGGTQPYQQDRIYDVNGISPALSAGKSDLLITSGTLRTHKDGEGFREVHSGKGATVPARAREDGSGQNVVMITSLNENQEKKFNPNINSDKANALTLAQGRAGSSDEYMDAVSKIANITSRIRRLTPLECMRLQTVSDDYKMPVSDSQKYKMLGNGWNIETIAHLFSYLPKQ
jgi:DNA-cytosine methyltransferase